MAERRRAGFTGSGGGFGSSGDSGGAGIEVEISAELSKFNAGMQELIRITKLYGDRTQSALKAINDTLKTQQEEIKKTSTAFENLNKTVSGLASGVRALAASYLVIKGIEIGKDAVQTALNFEKINRVLEAGAGSAKLGAEQYKFLRAETDRLGIVFQDASVEYGKLLAAVTSSGRPISVAQKVFSGFGEEIVRLGLSGEQTKSIFNALTQIFSKNKLQAQEAVIQIGQQLPTFIGSLQKVAKAAGVDLQDAFKKGNVAADASLKVVDEFRKVNINSAGAVKTNVAEINRLTNALDDVKRRFGDALLPTIINDFIPGLKNLSNTIITLIETWQNLDSAFEKSGPKTKIAIGILYLLKSGIDGATFGARQLLNLLGTEAPKEIDQYKKNIELLNNEISELEKGLTKAGEKLSEASENFAVASQFSTDKKEIAAYAEELNKAQKEFQDITVSIEIYKKRLIDARNEEKKYRGGINPDFSGAPQGPEAPPFLTSEKELEAARKREEREALKFAKTQKQIYDDLYKELIKIEEGEFVEFVKLLDLKLEKAKEFARKDVDLNELRNQFIEAKTKELTERALKADEKAIEEIERGENELLKKLAKQNQDATSAKIALIREEVAQLRAASYDKELITKYETEAIAKVYAEFYDEQEQERKKQLEEQQREIETFANTIGSKLGDVIFDNLKNGINSTKDLLKSLKETFFRVLADLAAKALTTNIIIPILGEIGFGQRGNQGGLGGILTTGGGRGINLSGLGSRVSGLLDTPLVSRTSDGRFLFGGSEVGARNQNLINGANQFDDSALTGGTGITGTITVGQAAQGASSAITSGIAGAGIAQLVTEFTAENISRRIFGETGAGGRVANIHAGITGGVVGGAVAGSQFGVVGIVVGAVIGAIVGGILGGLKSVAKKRTVQLRDVDVPNLVADQLGVTLESGFRILETYFRNTRPEQEEGFRNAIQDFADNFLFSTQALIQSFPEQFQNVLPQVINPKLSELETVLEENLKLSITSRRGSSLDAVIADFLQNKLPAFFQDIFGEILERAQRIASVFQGFEDVIDQLEQTRDSLARGFRDQRQQLEELLFTPAQTFEKRKVQLEQRLALFETGTAAERVALAPEIQTLIGELAQLSVGQDVLGQDLPLLIQYQQELLGILDEVESGSLDAVNGQIETSLNMYNEMLRQTDLLTSSREVFEAGFRRANITLDNISQFLEVSSRPLNLALVDPNYAAYLSLTRDAFFRDLNPNSGAVGGTPATVGGNVPTFQTGGVMPHTGLAYLHAGETILRPGQGGNYGNTIIVENNFNGNVENGAAENIARRTAETVATRLEQMSRLHQTTVDVRTPKYRNLRSTTSRPTGS